MGFCLIREPTSEVPALQELTSAWCQHSSRSSICKPRDPCAESTHGCGRGRGVSGACGRCLGPATCQRSWLGLPPTHTMRDTLFSQFPATWAPRSGSAFITAQRKPGSMIFCREGHGFPHTPGLCGAVSCGTLSQAPSVSQSVTAGSTWPPRTRATWPLHHGLGLLRRELSPTQNDALWVTQAAGGPTLTCAMFCLSNPRKP